MAQQRRLFNPSHPSLRQAVAGFLREIHVKRVNLTCLLIGFFLSLAMITSACRTATAASFSPTPTAKMAGVGTSPSAIASNTPEPTPSPTYTPRPTHTPSLPMMIGPEIYPEGVNPLTGLQVSELAVLERRPLVVKISNAPPVVRPQSGISYADLLLEHYAEGGWTRFTAIFYSQGVDHLGSVRSVRLVDLQLAPAFDGLLVFSGGSNGVIDTIRESPLYPYNTISPQFGYGEPYFRRFPREGLPFEHTLFSDTALLWQWADEHNVRHIPRFGTPGMTFYRLPPGGGIAANQAALEYAKTTVEWRYDPSTGRYMRWTDGIPHSDALTGQQLGFANVVVISAYHDEVDLFPEKYFGQEKSLYIELQGEGPMTLLRDGLAFEGHWRREAAGDMFSFTDMRGKPLPLKPGRTFIQIIRAGFEQLLIAP